ncbi:Rv3654c family TadE-like protein [Actinomyces sp. 565]|uniref:Rv3654c family TadE-like protein n=1 Tax=Actinomyces sp. 565 TaxID=2057794 RepID=UPI0013A6DEB9|nr:Rv3654c family TadE-like protein [Actinomyces sp. 565]NDR53304.1 flp pilus-assembly TadE/G-like family protein [Actinomyces sp. 565]
MRPFLTPGNGTRACGTGRAAAPAGRERGSGTVMVLGIIAVALCLALGAAGLIQAQAAAGRARSAADLAALAGATALSSVLAPADPCATAQRVAQANGAELGTCEIDGEDVTVMVTVPTRVLGIPRRAGAAARAGPVNPL